MGKQKIDPEALADDNGSENGDEDGDEEMDASEFIATALSEMLENGVPVRVTASDADPLIQPLLKRIQRQNEILAEINTSLRAIAIKYAGPIGTGLPLRTLDAVLKP
jgi:hypothetical protein